MIRLRGVTKAYEGKVVALRDLSLDVAKQELVARADGPERELLGREV